MPTGEIITEEPIYYPAQCSCGHIILEKYCVMVDDKTCRPFTWCGFCRTRVDLGDRPAKFVEAAQAPLLNEGDWG